MKDTDLEVYSCIADMQQYMKIHNDSKTKPGFIYLHKYFWTIEALAKTKQSQYLLDFYFYFWCYITIIIAKINLEKNKTRVKIFEDLDT